ncbi:Glucose/ribitol dehydrogenase [Penicillium robsamsonii]|uniref:Glucose/ribitol dehydrogenase n=1 Tax=Penicillium robsamsonii TaxID=1792511 RepID=UPI0025499ADA|nr:Glucose/ribitol dehydrogenase [Penicillium robsamsonii]KAJ5823882.1 Glucose/ribitol dehydrogenase [Penicillium robsamsonii]
MAESKSQRYPRVWFITGCSSGFGNIFVSAILASGDRVIATARDISTLSDFAHCDNVKVLELDITDSQDSLDENVSKAIAMFGHIDVLVNNAGYVLYGVLEELRCGILLCVTLWFLGPLVDFCLLCYINSQSQILNQFNTNFFGPLNLTRAVLPHMRSRQSGTVIFMSSIAAWKGVAVGGPYSASKFALEGFVESLKKEVAAFGVNLHLAVLGQFRTDILSAHRRQSGRGANSIRDYDAAVYAFKNRLEQTNGKQPGDPTQAVERIMDLVYRRGHFAGQEELPLRIVLGSDAVAIVRGECQQMLNDLKKQEEYGRSTDYQGTAGVGKYE